MDETELMFEPVPMPRGRVVARWMRTRPDVSYLDAGCFSVRVSPFDEEARAVVSFESDQSPTRELKTFYGPPERVARRAVEFIRSVIAPFGGELIAEGEP